MIIPRNRRTNKSDLRADLDFMLEVQLAVSDAVIQLLRVLEQSLRNGEAAEAIRRIQAQLPELTTKEFDEHLLLDELEQEFGEESK